MVDSSIFETMEIIKFEDWERKEIFRLFEGSRLPFYFVAFDVDVTEVYQYAHSGHKSFYHTMIWLVTKAACSVRNFRYRVKGDKIVLLDGLVPSFTVMLPGEELFRIVNCPMEDELDAFLEKAGQKCREQRSFLSEEDSEDLIFLSCVPWFATTAISNEHDTNPEDYFTRISWGMFVEREGRKVLNVTVDVNHRVIDGIHIARFRDELVRLIGTL